MALTDTLEAGTSPSDELTPRSVLGSWWAIVGFALLLLLALGWQLLLHPTWTAPTRDPAWYTWRANLILQADPGSIAREWGPDAVYSGGYRVTAPLAGALLQRIAGIDQYSFSAFLMVGIPVLGGLALGAAGFRSRRDALIVPLAMLAAVALFLTVPYVGYLDNLTMLFLLTVMLAFVAPARTSWGARVALFAIGVAAAFTHPTTCVLFGLSLLGVFAWHFVTSRLSLGSALKSDGPMLMSVGFGMILGLASWLIGIWGPRAKLSDAAAPPPYSKAFFLGRLAEWVGSMKPLVTVPVIVVAIVGVIAWSRRERKPANQFEIVSIWWLFPFVGALTFLFSAKPVPYYRFINASAAPAALVGLGAFIAIRWFLRREGAARIAGALASVLVVGALAWVSVDGLANRWTSERNQWVDESARTSLAAVNAVARAAGARPIVLVVNHDNTDDSTGTNTTYGWAKTFTNVFRTGLPGSSAQYQATYLGRLEDFLAGQPSTGPSAGYRTISRDYWNELRARRKAFPADPVVFVIGQYYGGAGDPSLVQADGVSIGPDVTVITKAGAIPLWTPPADVVAGAQQAAKMQAAAFADAPGPLSDPLHLLRVLLGLFALAVLPGLLAAPFFELDDTPSRIALIPGMSIVMTLLAGIAVLTVWRGQLTSSKAWVVVAVSVGAGALLRVGRERVLGVLRSFGGFFNDLFAVFSNRDYSVLMGVQFLAQAGQGVVQGAIAKSIAFGGQKGFDVQTVPSASYLLKVVLALYVPYMLISPFIGVFIDRFERRLVAWWAMVLSAILVAAVAVAVLLPIGKGTTAGRVGATAGLIVGLLVVQSVARVILAVKSAAIPDVLQGVDLMQGNGLSQAGGGLLQVVGIAFGGVAAGILPPWIVVIVGALVLTVGAIVSRQLQHAELHPHETSFAREASQVVRNVVAGLKEVAGRPAAALGLSSFQMLRYQFWGFVLFTWALYAKNLVTGGNADTLSLILSGIGALAGGALGVIVAQKLKDRVPPVRILLVSMAALGISVVVFGALVSVAGFAVLLFLGFFTFFTGKISTDTITQQTMPDDFRGRAFALFDIAYNLGYIVPALILSLVWIEDDPTRTRTILVVSGLLFLGLTALVAMWARRIRDRFAPQDDLVAVE